MVEPDDDFKDNFTQQINVFGIPVVGTPNVPVDKLTHFATIMAEYLDNDEDGNVDDPAVVDAMKSENAMIMVFADWGDASSILDTEEFLGYEITVLIADQTNVEGRFDTALEEILYLIHFTGY